MDIFPAGQSVRILLIEDHAADAVLIREALRDDPQATDFELTVCGTLAKGLQRASCEAFDVLLLDLNLPDSRGFETFKVARQQAVHLPIIVLTAMGGKELAQQAVTQGAQDYLFKDRLDPYWVARALIYAVRRHRLVQRLRVAEAREVAAAQQANQAKSEFLAALSHEIRSPIGTIIMATDMLLGDNLPVEERRDTMQMIKRSGEHLLTLVNDTLDLSRVEAGSLPIERETFAPEDVVEEVVRAFRQTGLQNGVSLHVSYAPDLPETMTADATRFRQVLTNLVSNAIKFTDKGCVLIRVDIDRTGGSPNLVVGVEDSGIGLSEEQKARLFRAYSQADESIHRKYGGTGLGLVLSRRIAVAMGGSLELSWSAPGSGSRFAFSLPAEHLRL